MTGLTGPTPEHLAELAACVDPGALVDAASDAAQPYFVEPRGIFRGRAAAISNSAELRREEPEFRNLLRDLDAEYIDR